MATRAQITVRTEAGFKSVYLHWDGYPDHALKVLEGHYSSQERAESLVEHGNLSSLHESNEQPEGHSFRTPVEGHCVYYGRDRGEEDQDAVVTQTIQPLGWGEEFHYIFDEGEWRVH